ncbi:MAG: xanthine dehydrogenase family protein subunit M [Desulfobacterales bacterium]|nr:xanthine dehydrogenase family protein subunit M [Desulfobacterales bacterium]
MNTFEYVPANTVKEACDLLSQYGEEAKILGGGQSLVNLMKQDFVSPSTIIDIKDISDLDYIRYDEKDGLRIGALTTHRSLETSAVVKDKFFMLAEMERTLASVPVRNWGTVGGNLAHADPASDLAPTLMALGAEVTVTGSDAERVISLDDFFIGYFETALQPDELLTEIHVPNSGQGGGIYSKFALRATDLAVVSVATHLIFDPNNSDLCKDVRIVMGSVGPTPLRSKRGEDLLKGQAIDDTLIEEAARLSAEDAQPTTDINGSEEYKREIVHVLVRRTVKEAKARASAP